MAQHRENVQNVGLENVNAVRRQMELLRDQIARIYVLIDAEKYPVVEDQIGDVLGAIRNACKRMRKAQAILAQEALPGINDPAAA